MVLAEGQFGGHGAVDTFDLAVCLRPVGAGKAGLHIEFGAGPLPEFRAVAAAVVGRDPFDGDTTSSEPVDCTLEHPSGCDSGFVIVDLSVGDAGAVVDDGVDERVTK